MKSFFWKLIIVFLFIISCSSENQDDSIPDLKVSCNDGVKNGDETSIDCGGSCLPCPVGLEIPTSGFTSPLNYDEYALVWQDEFESDELDDSKWSYHLGSGCPNLCGWGNNELQYYTDKKENLYFEKGNLIIEAKKERIQGKDYSSSRIHTDDKFEFQYGRIDIRASMPSATGTWVAMWLLNHNYEVINPGKWWPKGGEIDVVEYLGEQPNEILGTAHYGSNLSNHNYNSKIYEASVEDFDTIYYVFSIIWEKDKITWLVDDLEYHSITPAQTMGQPFPFNDEFYLLLNLSVGGNLPISPVNFEFPAYMIVDYIRVFQKN